jgi:nucleotide-binding universal stress UspA family protein
MAEGMVIRRILVPLDGSELAEQAIPDAVALAANSAEIVLFQAVVNAEPERNLLGHVKHDSGEVAQRETELCLQNLQEIGRRWASILPGTPRYEVGFGEPAAAIVAASQRLDCDLIVAASHGRGAIRRWAFGSVADALARTATVPVMIVRAKDAAREIAVPEFGRVIVPYDGSELAAGALPVAIELAKRLNAKVLLVEAVASTVVPPIATPSEPYYSAEVYDDLISELEEEATSTLESAAAQVRQSGVPTSQTVLLGSPIEVITETAKSGDLIVMTSHGRSGLERWFLGSVSEQLVREGPVPVVVVPAAGRTEQQAMSDER